MSEAVQTRLTGWGRSTGSVADVYRARDAGDVAELMRRSATGHVLARGLGRSYGDAAQNAGGAVVAPIAPDAPIELDRAAGVARLSAGTSIDRALRTLLPQGFTLPVLPGTRFVTIGGAIASDVHGKNHHCDGSFGRWVREIELVDGTGELRVLSPDEDADAFWATVAGMGLTGVICWAKVELTPVRSAAINVRTRRFSDLAGAMAAMAASSARHHVAWVDASSHAVLGRAVLDEGDHADASFLTFAPRQPVPTPAIPVNLVRPSLMRCANAAWWHRAPTDRRDTVSFSSFFHPLDAVGDWHRVYGPAGMIQWQMVVPMSASGLVEESLRHLVDAGLPPTLVVLKRMGAGNEAPLSFPIEGWTLALDLPAGRPGLRRALQVLDERLVDAGGRIYLAKDSGATPEHISEMYPHLPTWRETRKRLDPLGIVSSDLGRRLGLM